MRRCGGAYSAAAVERCAFVRETEQ